MTSVFYLYHVEPLWHQFVIIAICNFCRICWFPLQYGTFIVLVDCLYYVRLLLHQLVAPAIWDPCYLSLLFPVGGTYIALLGGFWYMRLLLMQWVASVIEIDLNCQRCDTRAVLIFGFYLIV